VIERSNDRVSKIGERTAGVNILTAITHPGIATLADPLFAARKEGKLYIYKTNLHKSLIT
jgi:hypothetical protein